MTRPLYPHPNNWMVATLEPNPQSGVIVEAVSGSTPPTEDESYWGGTFPWLTPKEITDASYGRTVAVTERSLTSKGLKKAGSLCDVGSVLLTKRAPVGIPVMNSVPLAINQGFLSFRCGGRLDPTFLYYWFRLNGPYLEAVANGSTYPELYVGDLFEFEIAFPSIDEQQHIVSILSALDDKIELNRQANETLAAIGRLIFSSWFDNHASSACARSVQELLDENVLLIGDGYRAKISEFDREGLPFVRAGNLKDHGFVFDDMEILSATSVAKAGNKVSETDDIAFTSKGTVGRITRVSSHTRRFVYSPQVCFWRVLDRSQLDPNVLYRWMESNEFMAQVAAVKGQTDMAEYVSLQDQRQMNLTLPMEAQREIAGSLRAVDNKIAANLNENRILTKLRDMLLLKLLSGGVRFDNIGG